MPGAAVLWGLGFAGMATVLQTASGNAAGAAADTAQAMLVTLWNTRRGTGVSASRLLSVRPATIITTDGAPAADPP
jgi:hypothetical protein